MPGKAWLGRGRARDLRRHIFADEGAVFEAVARASADQPRVPAFGMAVDQKIAGGGVFVLADARFEQRRVGQSREALAQQRARAPQRRWGEFAAAGFWIERGAVRIEGQLEAAAVQRGDRVGSFTPRDPGGHGSEGGRRAEVEHFLPRGADAAAQNPGKQLREPGTAGVYDRAGADVHVARANFIVHAGSLDHSLHGATSQQDSTRRLPDGGGFAIQMEQRELFPQCRVLQVFMLHTAA